MSNTEQDETRGTGVNSGVDEGMSRSARRQEGRAQETTEWEQASQDGEDG